VKEGDVYRHWRGQYYKITSMRNEAGKEIVRLVSPRGNKSQLTKSQFKNPVKADGGDIVRFKGANDDPGNPWKKK